jgi:hypothetical protein
VLTDRKHSVPARNAARARIAVCVSCVLYTQATQHSELWSIRTEFQFHPLTRRFCQADESDVTTVSKTKELKTLWQRVIATSVLEAGSCVSASSPFSATLRDTLEPAAYLMVSLLEALICRRGNHHNNTQPLVRGRRDRPRRANRLLAEPRARAAHHSAVVLQPLRDVCGGGLVEYDACRVPAVSGCSAAGRGGR